MRDATDIQIISLASLPDQAIGFSLAAAGGPPRTSFARFDFLPANKRLTDREEKQIGKGASPKPHRTVATARGIFHSDVSK